MGFISYVKNWVSGEVLTASDLNADFADVVASVNGNLDDTNIVAGAAIKGSKLADAPNGLTTTKLNDLAVTGAKLAVGAALQGVQTGSAVLGMAVTAGSGEHPWATIPSLTTRGGNVLLFGSCTGAFVIGGSLNGTLTVRVRRDGVLVQTMNYFLQAPGGTGNASYPVSCPSLMNGPPAGAHVYAVTVEITGFGVFITDASAAGFFQAAELS